MKYFHDGKTSVQTNEISKCKWSHWDVCSKFHGFVNIFNSSDSFIKCKNGFVNIWNQDSICEKSRNISCKGASFLHGVRECESFSKCIITCLETLNYFNKLHYRNRVHKMHSNNLMSSWWNDTCNLCNRD